jgi:hypothetical protein
MTLKPGNMEDYKSKMGFCGIAIDRLLFPVDSYIQADQPAKVGLNFPVLV